MTKPPTPSSDLSSKPPSSRGWILFTLDEHWFAVRHEGVRSIEPWRELEPVAAPVAGLSGYYVKHGERWPAYRLDAQLRPLADDSPPRFALFLECFPAPAGIGSSQVRILAAAQAPDLRPLPALFATAPGPVEGVLLLENERLAPALDPILLGRLLGSPLSEEVRP